MDIPVSAHVGCTAIGSSIPRHLAVCRARQYSFPQTEGSTLVTVPEIAEVALVLHSFRALQIAPWLQPATTGTHPGFKMNYISFCTKVQVCAISA